MKANRVGVYLVDGKAGTGADGAPMLHFSLLVNASTGSITGQARHSQATQGPTSNVAIDNISGQIRYTGLGQYTKIVALQGTAAIAATPPAIGCYVASFSAHFAINEGWEGTGGWTLDNIIEVNDVPVQPNHD